MRLFTKTHQKKRIELLNFISLIRSTEAAMDMPEEPHSVSSPRSPSHRDRSHSYHDSHSHHRRDSHTRSRSHDRSHRDHYRHDSYDTSRYTDDEAKNDGRTLYVHDSSSPLLCLLCQVVVQTENSRALCSIPFDLPRVVRRTVSIVRPNLAISEQLIRLSHVFWHSPNSPLTIRIIHYLVMLPVFPTMLPIMTSETSSPPSDSWRKSSSFATLKAVHGTSLTPVTTL